MTDEEQTDSADEDTAPTRRTALTRAEVWENAFIAWWIRYLRKYYGVGPESRHLAPYAAAETAAADAASWARKRTSREQRVTANEELVKLLIRVRASHQRHGRLLGSIAADVAAALRELRR